MTKKADEKIKASMKDKDTFENIKINIHGTAQAPNVENSNNANDPLNGFNLIQAAATVYAYTKAILNYTSKASFDNIRMGLEAAAFLEVGLVGSTMLCYYFATRIAEILIVANLVASLNNDSSKYAFASNLINLCLFAASLSSPGITTLALYMGARWAVNETAANCVKIDTALKAAGTKQQDFTETLYAASQMTAKKAYAQGQESLSMLLAKVKSPLRKAGVLADERLDDAAQKQAPDNEADDASFNLSTASATH